MQAARRRETIMGSSRRHAADHVRRREGHERHDDRATNQRTRQEFLLRDRGPGYATKTAVVPAKAKPKIGTSRLAKPDRWLCDCMAPQIRMGSVRRRVALEGGFTVKSDSMTARLYVDNYRCLVNFECKLGAEQLILGPDGEEGGIRCPDDAR